MTRTRRTRGGASGAVKRTARRVRTAQSRRAAAAGGDLAKAVQKLVKALPIRDLEKRLAGLEKTVARLGASLRKVAKRSAAKRTGAKRSAAKRSVRKAGARKSTARKRTARKTSARAVEPVV
jgi:DNA-binding protein HU-beta